MRKFLVAAIALSLICGPASAATKKASPTPKATTKATAKATAKTSTKSTAKTTAKTTAKATSKSTSKSTAKSTTTKKPVVKRTYKPRPRRTVKLTPPPKEKWPPKDYVQNGYIYAKVPTKIELKVLSSKQKSLAKDLDKFKCADLACGAIIATSKNACIWWEITGDLVGPASDTDKTIIKYGSIVALYGKTKAQEIKGYVLATDEKIVVGHVVSNIKVACHGDPIPSDLKVPSNTYVKNN